MACYDGDEFAPLYITRAGHAGTPDYPWVVHKVLPTNHFKMRCYERAQTSYRTLLETWDQAKLIADCGTIRYWRLVNGFIGVTMPYVVKANPVSLDASSSPIQSSYRFPVPIAFLTAEASTRHTLQHIPEPHGDDPIVTIEVAITLYPPKSGWSVMVAESLRYERPLYALSADQIIDLELRYDDEPPGKSAITEAPLPHWEIAASTPPSYYPPLPARHNLPSPPLWAGPTPLSLSSGGH